MSEINIAKIEKKIQNVLKTLKDQCQNSEFFSKFVENLKISKIDQNKIVLMAINNFSKQVIKNDFLPSIKTIFNKIDDTNFEFDIISENENRIIKNKIDFNQHGNIIGLNKEYTFDSLICGDFNKAPITAGKNIVNSSFISPLFITGSVGLGKTHILHAIGNEYIKVFPNKNVRYVSSDDFSREIYNGLISEDKTLIEKIKADYNSYDLLLFDDIQILARRNKINEILFGIFNNAISHKRYIIFTSDKDINLLSGFEDRMKSRFYSGITTTIQKPKMDDVKKIIEIKVNGLGNAYKFSDDAKNFIARRNTNDIRKLEGDINQLFFFAANNLPKFSIINLKMVKNILAPNNSEEINSYGYDIDPLIVIDQICQSYNVKSELVRSKSKLKYLLTPRNVCMYVLRNKFNMTYTQIGQLFSGRDHSTVMTSIEKINKIMKTDPNLEITIKNIYEKL